MNKVAVYYNGSGTRISNTPSYAKINLTNFGTYWKVQISQIQKTRKNASYGNVPENITDRVKAPILGRRP